MIKVRRERASSDSYQKSRLTYSQKSEKYAHENEFRFVFCRKEFAGNNLIIRLPSGIGGVIHEYT
jgi:hypothetical protein